MTALEDRRETERTGEGAPAHGRANTLAGPYADALVWALLLSAPAWLPYVGGYTELGARIVILGLGALSLNFLLGFTGVLSFGHAAYFGLGAYGAGLTLKYLLPNTLAALAVGILVGTLAGAVLGALIVRLRGVYFAMVTIAFGQVFYYIAFRWSSVTGGDDGLRGFARQAIDLGPWHVNIGSDHPVVFYYFVLVVFALSTAAMAALLRSPLGRTLLAIRENERRARFLGLPVEQHVWLAFVISCLFMSVSGALNAFLDNFANPRDLHWQFSGNFVIMVVLGGMRSFWGPLLGATFFVALQDYLSSMTQNWMSLIGVLFVLVVLFFPRGILGFVRRRSAA
jgi:branched-chain amino acid transport system permease protein